MSAKEHVKSAVTYRMIAEALFDNYESIYDIHRDTHAYKTYYQSDYYQELELAKEGQDFFKDLPAGIYRIIAPEDQKYMLRMLNKETMLSNLKKEKLWRLVYRINYEGKSLYHQLRAILQEADDGVHILMGIKNIDDLIRQRIEYAQQMESMRQQESNYLDAVLASAAAYLEANLTGNLMLEKSAGHQEELSRQIRDIPPVSEMPCYDAMQRWIGNNLVAGNKEKYMRISDRHYLMDCYMKGEKRASVSFSVYVKDGEPQPCRAIFFLYRERATGNLHVLCVIYDLTEQQRKEQELQEIEEELRMSRIRNFTSQMQPHFLYNALGSIQELILIDPQYASDLLGDFMVHLRSCVRAMSADEPISISEELKNIQAYVNIEKMRLGNKLDMTYDIKAEDFSVLPLSIQPLVENAIRHGVHKRGRKGGRVVLRTWSEEDARIVEVEDTGVGFDVENIQEEVAQGKRDSTGLSNIRFRLEKVMGAKLEIHSVVGAGTRVTVRIPMKGVENESDHRG